jgi:hypothetical protein
MQQAGFFVDWNGDTRRVESPGDGYSCQIVDRGTYISVEVSDDASFVCHEATFSPTIKDLEAASVVVRLLLCRACPGGGRAARTARPGETELSTNTPSMSDNRKEVFRQAIIGQVNAHIKSHGITPEEAAAVFAEEAKTALDHLGWKPHPQRAASEHLVVATACLNDGLALPVPGFDALFPLPKRPADLQGLSEARFAGPAPGAAPE